MAQQCLCRTPVTQRFAANRRVTRSSTTKCAAQLRNSPDREVGTDATKRATLAALAASVILPVVGPASAVEYKTFYGLATPPTSYGGYGGNAKEEPKYTFEYPATWKEDVPNKVEKGTQGIDGRVINPRSKNQRAFVITLARAGEDDKSFKLTDLDSTFASFAGADYDLQDALSAATMVENSQRTVNGLTFFDYDIEGAGFRYLSTITTQKGKVFALFVRSPSKDFANVEEPLRHIVETFKLL